MAIPRDVQDSVTAQADSLLQQKASAQDAVAQADSSVTTPDAPQQQTTTEVVAQDIQTRLTTPTDVGITVGPVRSIEQDLTNQAVLQNIVSDQIAQLQTIAQAANQPAVPATVSTTQTVAAYTNRVVVSQRRQQEIVQGLQKLQRTCNHKYDKVSRRCLYCSKHRDSHVQDDQNTILKDIT